MQKTGSAGFILYRGLPLLHLRDNNPGIANPNRHALPGGGTELCDNTYYHTFRRELYEELGLTIPVCRMRYIGIEIMPGGLNYFFIVTIDRKEHVRISLKEGQSYSFYRQHELYELHTRGGEELGLGGAIHRFMTYNPEIIDQIYNGYYPQFALPRE